MTDKYIPISCNYHDILESISMRRELCTITYVDESNAQHTVRDRISDIFARQGEEFIKLDSGTMIRLDRLRLVNETWFGSRSC
jgi:Rho-binding antiterminator